MATDKLLRLVIVTPETTLLDREVAALRFPLYDGDIGILPGRLPLIGRLGAGELSLQLPDHSTQQLFVDGGFVQVRGGVVTLLTNKAVFATQLSAPEAQRELDEALSQKPTTEAGFKSKERAQQSARRKLALARQSR